MIKLVAGVQRLRMKMVSLVNKSRTSYHSADNEQLESDARLQAVTQGWPSIILIIIDFKFCPSIFKRWTLCAQLNFWGGNRKSKRG